MYVMIKGLLTIIGCVIAMIAIAIPIGILKLTQDYINKCGSGQQCRNNGEEYPSYHAPWKR